jgi:hypothetical protein
MYIPSLKLIVALHYRSIRVEEGNVSTTIPYNLLKSNFSYCYVNTKSENFFVTSTLKNLSITDMQRRAIQDSFDNAQREYDDIRKNEYEDLQVLKMYVKLHKMKLKYY